MSVLLLPSEKFPRRRRRRLPDSCQPGLSQPIGVILIPVGVTLIPMGVEPTDAPPWRPTMAGPFIRKPEKSPKNAKKNSIRPPTSRQDRCALLLPFIY